MDASEIRKATSSRRKTERIGSQIFGTDVMRPSAIRAKLLQSS
jgi:hypothetical protein